MSPVKIHNRDFFYKYFSFEGAVKTLENNTFLYKAPAFFNDPFDSQIILQPGISEEEMAEIFFDALAEAIVKKQPEPRLGLTADRLSSLPSHLDKDGLLRIKEELLAAIPKNYFMDAHKKAADGQWQCFRDNVVFCVTEKFDNLLMWSHYADEHKGAVFKIKCIEEKQSLLCAALPVIYNNRYPQYGNIEEWRNFVNSGNPPNIQRVYNELITTKSTEWEYENEWRVVFPRSEDRGKEFVLLNFNPEEIEHVILGCRMPEEGRTLLSRLIREKYPLTKIFQARKSQNEFCLHFDELS